MFRPRFRLLSSSIFLSLVLPGLAQSPAPQPKGAQPAVASTAPAATFQINSHLVNVELVVKDSKGKHIQGLKPEDIQILEQTPDKSRKWNQQKVVDFREVHMAGMPTPVSIQAPMPKGVYSNAVTIQKDPVPPTILLVDGLNTPVEHQAQVHVQMLKMLRQIPPNVPAAVFLLGDKLEMLQGFTSDPKLLQAALSKATSTANVGAAMDPRDDPDSVGNMLGGQITPDAPSGSSRFAGLAAAASEFELKIFIATSDERVDRTINALTSLSDNVAGYPGRKNLLWLSTSFPISLFSDLVVGAGGVGSTPVDQGAAPGASTGIGQDIWAEVRSHLNQLRHLSAVLSDAKVSVYPVNVAGVQTLQMYQGGSRPPNLTAYGMSDSALRDTVMQNAAVDTMHEVADGTGGIVCTGDNDLGDCVRKAVDDSSDFYEISYYSDSPDWKGEFRKIAVKTAQHGAHLAYRQGYFATPEGSPGSKAQTAQLRSDCENYLDATSLPFTATSLPPDPQGQLRFSLLIDSSALTLRPAADGKYPLNLAVGVCTYNEKGWAVNLMNYPVNFRLSPEQFETARATGKLADSIRVPGPKPAALRLLVKDVPSGRLGSIRIDLSDLEAAAPAAAALGAQQAPK